MTTLSDNEIKGEIDAQRLVRNADPTMLEGACYQLRMGNVYYDLTEHGVRFALKQGEAVLIKPGHRVVLITAEELAIPPDILVRVVSKGSLFSIGLSPVATYADPGFAGNLVHRFHEADPRRGIPSVTGRLVGSRGVNVVAGHHGSTSSRGGIVDRLG